MKWILVKDDLPKNDNEVWVTVECESKRYVYEMIYDDNKWCEWDYDYNDYLPIYNQYNVIAWMNKTEPEPYMG